MTQSQAAEMLGVSRATIQATERGSTVKRILECASLALQDRDRVYRYIETLSMEEYLAVKRRRKRNGVVDG